jgi:mono/diheme cytochrome c family protein
VTVWRWSLTAALVWAGGLTQIRAQPADTPAQTVWSGVYSEAQAYRGEKVVDTVCLGCHGAGLEGGDSGPRLVGEHFLSAWNKKSVGDLFDFIFETMPKNAPRTMRKEDIASVIAYMLKHNDLPAGRQELSAERDALAQITIFATKP